MQEVYAWVSNIVYYMVFVTMIINLLPSGKYEKYLRLFAGCILILLVISPVTGGLRLEEKMAGVFKTLSFENEVGELTADLEDMEGRRLGALITRYEEAAEADISRMASMEGYEEQVVSVKIDREEDSPDFGKVKQISVLLKNGQTTHAGGSMGVPEYTEAPETIGGPENTGSTIERVEPVKIEVGSTDAAPHSSLVSAPGRAEPEQVKRLKKEIAGYYQVEEQYVEIKLENE